MTLLRSLVSRQGRHQGRIWWVSSVITQDRIIGNQHNQQRNLRYCKVCFLSRLPILISFKIVCRIWNRMLSRKLAVPSFRQSYNSIKDSSYRGRTSVPSRRLKGQHLAKSMTFKKTVDTKLTPARIIPVINQDALGLQKSYRNKDTRTSSRLQLLLLS